MITGIIFGKLRNAELLQFMKNTATLVAGNDLSVLNVTAQHAALQNQITAMETLFKVSQASETTQELQELDARRDKAIVGIGLVVEGYASHFNPDKALAAKRLSDNLALYGERIYRQNYQAETAMLNAILADWSNKPELADAVTLLQLGDWKKEMQDANNLFDAKYLARTQDYGAASPDTLKAEREETYQAYYKLRDRIVAFATIQDNPDPAYAKTINELNALIAQYNALVRDRVPEAPEAPTE